MKYDPNCDKLDISYSGITYSRTTSTTTTGTTTTSTTHPPFTYLSTTPPPPSIEQQTFLGASIVSFKCNASFGDGVSQVNVTLVEDPANNDAFNPPAVGQPVFFTFGDQQRNATDDATIGQGFYSTIDDLYRANKPIYTGAPANTYTHHHFAFGGLLQSYHYNQDASSGQLITAVVVDPREILSGFNLILNNHAGTTYSNDNLINIYGFLEHVSPSFRASFMTSANLLGSYTVGNIPFPGNPDGLPGNCYIQGRPVTGTGMSLRSETGIPLFRIIQAFNSLMGMHQFPVVQGSEYAQYGGWLKFRGKKYLLDLSDLPIPDPFYQISGESMNLLEFCTELCDASNHELMVSLLPLNNRSGTPLATYWSNFSGVQNVGGVIKVTSIDRSSSSGQVSQDYIDSLPFWTTQQDIGTEMATEVTDKFVTGAKEVNMYYFKSTLDQWYRHGLHKLENSFKAQVLPYYGTLGTGMATIPRGKGPWSQIILDSSTCGAAGVGPYYVATEIELRAVDISFDKWVDFLLQYNRLYKEVVSNGAIQDDAAADTPVADGDGNQTGALEITVPRCTWPPHPDDLTRFNNGQGTCSPPYGYPLYWGRATAIGLWSGGSVGLSATSPDLVSGGNGAVKPEAAKQFGADATSDKNKAHQTASSIASAEKGLENAKMVYNFLKGITDECLGKKFLVKIPQKVNAGWGVDEPWGFVPRNSAGDAQPQANGGFWNVTNKNKYLASILPANARTKGALEIGWNIGSASYEFNYFPEPAGGSEGVALAPPQLSAFFASSGRIPCWVQLPYSSDLNISSVNKNESVYYNGSLFVTAELDSNFLISPPTVNLLAPVYGATHYKEETVTTENLDTINPFDGSIEVCRQVRPKIYYPKGASGNTARLLTIDLVRAKNNNNPNYYTEGFDVYCLITIPRVTMTEEGNFREGVRNKVNLANLTHYLREDVVMGMPGFGAVPQLPSGKPWKLPSGQTGDAFEKAVSGLTFSTTRSILMTSPGPIWPEIVAIPLTSNERSYGPWYNGSNGGKLEYIHEESLAPWNFTGDYTMDDMGTLLASQTTSTDLSTERASFTMVGWPSGLTVGGLLQDGPAITNISTDFSTGGIKTTVTMDSYTPSFGKLQKQRQKMISKISKQQGQLRDNINAMIKKGIVNTKNNFSFTAFAAANAASSSNSNTYESSPLEKGHVDNPNTVNMSYAPLSITRNGTAEQGDTSLSYSGSSKVFAKSSGLLSSVTQAEMSAIMSSSTSAYLRQYFNSISTSFGELFHPASSTWHYFLPTMKQPIDRLMYGDDLDSSDDIHYYD